MTAPIILEKVLRNMRKESTKTPVRTDDTPRLRERTSQHVVDCVDVFRKSVHNTANRLRRIGQWVENLTQPDGAYCCLKKGHWAVHDAANGILHGR